MLNNQSNQFCLLDKKTKQRNDDKQTTQPKKKKIIEKQEKPQEKPIEKSQENIVKEVEPTINELKYLNTDWTLWCHKNTNLNWKAESYEYITNINTIDKFWEIFNNFHKLNKDEYQYFIMRDKIKPIWEDNNNRNGGILSYKLNLYNATPKDDGSLYFTILSLLILNETFTKKMDTMINGISYAMKNNNVLIKIWYNNWNDKTIENDKSKKELEDKIRILIDNTNKQKRNNMSNFSIRYSKIEPEDA